MVKHLILDMDETLIYTLEENEKNIEHDYILKFEDGIIKGVKRPYLDEFIKKAFEVFDSVSVWSAGSYHYVHQTLEKNLGSFKKKLRFIMTREDCCVVRNGKEKYPIRYKPLEKVYQKYKDMNTRNTLMIDDREDILIDDCLNIITINRFFGDKNDDSLKKIAEWFDKIKDSENFQFLKKPNDFF